MLDEKYLRIKLNNEHLKYQAKSLCMLLEYLPDVEILHAVSTD